MGLAPSGNWLEDFIHALFSCDNNPSCIDSRMEIFMWVNTSMTRRTGVEYTLTARRWSACRHIFITVLNIDFLPIFPIGALSLDRTINRRAMNTMANGKMIVKRAMVSYVSDSSPFYFHLFIWGHSRLFLLILSPCIGTYTYVDGDRYVGLWSNDMKNGQVFFYFLHQSMKSVISILLITTRGCSLSLMVTSFMMVNGLMTNPRSILMLIRLNRARCACNPINTPHLCQGSSFRSSPRCLTCWITLLLRYACNLQHTFMCLSKWGSVYIAWWTNDGHVRIIWSIVMKFE